jgi:acetyl-CoA carboxylase alpha subunit
VLKEALLRNTEELKTLSSDELVEKRHSRLMGYGTFISG